MGPERAKSCPGRRLVTSDPSGEQRTRATQEIDYGRRGSGYIFGAFVASTGPRVARSRPYTRLCGAGQSVRPPGPRRAALGAGSSALGVRLPTDQGRLPQPDRTVVEDPPLARPQRRPLCQLGGGLSGRGGSDAVLERPSPSLRLGPPPTPPPRPSDRHRLPPSSRMNLPDEPLSLVI